MTNNPQNLALGRAIQTCRKRGAISPDEVAKRAGIPLDEYLQIEKGEIEARWGHLRRIANKALEIPLPELFTLMERELGHEQTEDTEGSQPPPNASS